MAVRETIYYRKLTDKAETDEETPVVSIDVSDIALGECSIPIKIFFFVLFLCVF